MGEPRWLTAAEMRAWLPYVKSAVRILALLDRDLKQRFGISGADYEVLHHLSEDPEHMLRLGDLATLVADSASRMSHRIDRLASRGLLTRESVADDGRGRAVRLTETGYALLQRAAPEHVALVRRLFIDAFAPEDLALLARCNTQLAAHLAADRHDDEPLSSPS